MKAFASLLAILLLAACSNLPTTSSARSEQSGQVAHPDAFHSYVD